MGGKVRCKARSWFTKLRGELTCKDGPVDTVDHTLDNVLADVAVNVSSV